MQILRTNLDGTNQQIDDTIYFANPADYLNYAQNVSSEGFLIVVGEGLDNTTGGGKINIYAIAISGALVLNNFREPEVP